MKSSSTNHLQLFAKLFDHDKVRQLPGKLEFRVQNLDSSLQVARNIIKAHNLNLIAQTSGNMAAIRAFEVKEVTQ